jgi:type I restriction enzyme S subunit
MTAMDGWTKGTLGGLCSIEIGGTPSRSNPEYWDSAKDTSNRWVSIKDLNRRTVCETSEQITDLGVRNSNVKLQPKGTVLLSFKLSIGRVAFTGCDLYTNEAIAGLRSEELTPEFLFYGLQQWDLLQNVDQAIKGATLNKDKLKKIEFEHPESQVEQAKIAEVLSTLDRAIEQTEAQIAKQQRIKTGLMQDLLTKGIDEHGNIRSETTHAFKDSPLGRIPVEWDVKPLEQCVEFLDGKRVPLKQADRDLMEGDIPYYGASGIIDFIDRWLFNEELILLGEDGENVVSRNLPLAFKISGKCWVNNHAHVLRPLSSNDIDFLVERLEFHDYSLLVSGSAQPKLNQRNLCNMELPMPGFHEQQKIASVIKAVNVYTNQHVDELEKHNLVKTGLMHDLLTGERRVTPLLAQAAPH